MLTQHTQEIFISMNRPISRFFLVGGYWQLSDAGMTSTTSVHTVRKVTVVINTRRPHRDHCQQGQPYHAHNTLRIG